MAYCTQHTKHNKTKTLTLHTCSR